MAANSKTENSGQHFAAQFDNTQGAPKADEPKDGKLPSAFTLFRPSSELVQRNLLNFGLLLLVPTIYFGIAAKFFDPKTANSHEAFWIVVAGIGLAYNLVVFAAKPVLELRTAQGQQLQLMETIKLGWHYFWRLIGLYITIVVFILGGFLLLIVPGVIMVRRYELASYFLIDQDLSIREAMRRSAAATKPYSGAVWGLIGVQALMSVPSWIPFIGPLLAACTSTLYSCAAALRYEEIKALTATTPSAGKKPA